MARIASVNLISGKRIVISLTGVRGVGHTLAAKLCAAANVDPGKKTADLTNEEEARLQIEVQKYPTEGDLRRQVQQNIKLLQDISSYRGTRHQRRLPCRGQRTKTNARTKRGKKVTMGSGKRKESKT